MRNLLILLFALVMSHPVIAQSGVSITVKDIDVKVTEKDGVFFTVKTVNATGLSDGQTVNVYYYLQGDKSGKNGSVDKPEMAKPEGKVYTFTISDFQTDSNDNKYTVVVFGGVGDPKETGFIKGTEEYVTFVMGKNDGEDDGKKDDKPEVPMTFTEKSGSSVQDDSHAQIFVQLLVDVGNCQEPPTLYYNLYLDEEPDPIAKDVKLDKHMVDFVRYNYEATIPNLSFSRKYRVEVYAIVDYFWIPVIYNYDPIEFTETTPDDPNAPAVSIELEDIESEVKDNKVTFTVKTVNTQGLDDQKVDVWYYVKGDKSGNNGKESDPLKAQVKDNTYTFTVSDLKPDDSNTDNKYTAVIFGGVGDPKESGFIKGTVYYVDFEMKQQNPEITITFPKGSYYSEKQNDNYAKIFVKPDVVATPLSELPILYYDLYLDGTLIRKGVKMDTDGYPDYSATIKDLLFSSKYEVKVYATLGGFTSDPVSFTITTVNNDGVTTLLIETDGNSDVRYFDLQGNELKNPAKGRVYIKVEGNKAVKVVK